MECIEKLVDNIYDNCKIPFQLMIEDFGVYETSDFIPEKSISKGLNFKDTKCCINVNATFGNTVNLLTYCIENELKDVLIDKKDIISSLISGKDIENYIISAVWPVLADKFYLIDVCMEYKTDEIYSYFNEVYDNNDVEVLMHNDHLVILGKFEDIREHLISIKDSLINNVKGRFYISYCLVDNFSKLKKAYDNCEYKLSLANKYKLTETILDEKKCIIEGIVDSVSKEMKNEIITSYDEGISKLDNEMIKTIEVFFRCGLNLSDAAKELYIHRNTLIYRLEKIEKLTNFDIREFNNAVLFKIIFLIWKEKN